MKKIYTIIFILAWLFSFKSFSQCSTPSVVPYFEGFQGITANNQLPACWLNTAGALTYTTSSGNYGFFDNSSVGTKYFYSNAIQLNAGITYSMSAIYKVYASNLTWVNFSLWLSPGQGTLGLVPVASTSGTITNTSFAVLSNTFTVPSSTIYYVAIKGVNNAVAYTFGNPNLDWDNLSITIPCTPVYNPLPLTISASPTVICDQIVNQVTVTATGASTYSWNTAATTASISDSPTGSISYQVTGTSLLTGCTATASITLQANPSPVVSIVSNSAVACSGTSVNLVGTGANSYSWSTGQPGSFISVSPSLTTVYTVTGTNTYNCSMSATVQIAINPSPSISITATPTLICRGETATLSASGATSYQWGSVNGNMAGASVPVSPQQTITYSVTGTDNNNCTGKATYFLRVNTCTGLNSITGADAALKIYPNPGTGNFVLESGSSELKTIVITDALGKIVFMMDDANEQTAIDLSHVASGIYLVKIFSDNATDYLKIIKE